MKILLTGGKGMLGRTLVRELGGDFDVIATDLPEADITVAGVPARRIAGSSCRPRNTHVNVRPSPVGSDETSTAGSTTFGRSPRSTPPVS